MDEAKGTEIWTDWLAFNEVVVLHPVEGLETVIVALLSPEAVRMV